MDHIELQLRESTHGASTLQININGQSLIDLVRKVEQPFADLEGRPHAAGEYDWMVGIACELFDPSVQEVTVLGCTCGEADCWPLLCKVERLPGQIRWSGFYNPYRTVKSVAKLDDPAYRRIVSWDYKELGFVFDPSEYDAAFVELQSALNAERQRLDAEQAGRWARIKPNRKGLHESAPDRCVHEVVLNEKLQQAAFKTGAGAAEAGVQASAGAGAIRSVLRDIYSVNLDQVSKVVDAEGKPLVVYHGTPNVFDEFDPKKTRENGAADFDSNPLPPFLRRWPATDTPREAVILLANIDNRIAWLAERGLRPHPNVIERRAEVAAIVEANAMLERVTQAELQEPTRCLTPLLGELERETSEAIEQIAAVTRPAPLKPPEVFHGRFHNPRHRSAEPKPERLGLIRRVLRWLGLDRFGRFVGWCGCSQN